MSELLDRQFLFSRSVPLLLHRIEFEGLQYKLGEIERKPGQAALNAAAGIGISNSLHLLGLAIDVHLFKDGVYLTDSSAHYKFGQFWKSLTSLHRWGGDFLDASGRPKPDGNHYSIEYQGRK